MSCARLHGRLKLSDVVARLPDGFDELGLIAVESGGWILSDPAEIEAVAAAYRLDPGRLLIVRQASRLDDLIGDATSPANAVAHYIERVRAMRRLPASAGLSPAQLRVADLVALAVRLDVTGNHLEDLAAAALDKTGNAARVSLARHEGAPRLEVHPATVRGRSGSLRALSLRSDRDAKAPLSIGRLPRHPEPLGHPGRFANPS